jgi:hypothetical protein
MTKTGTTRHDAVEIELSPSHPHASRGARGEGGLVAMGLSRWCTLFVVVLLVEVMAPAPSWADRRIFGYSYPYMTLPGGGLEVEHYLDASFSEADDPSTDQVERGLRPSWTHQVEVEYAVTDRWDFGVYHVFRQKAYQDFAYRGAKLRSRYRFGDPGDLPIDPAIYGEVVYYGDEVKLEEILILSRSFGALELSVNLKVEQEFKVYDDEIEHEIVPSVGIGYHLNEQIAVAAEYLGKVELEHGEAGDMGHFVGPSISLQGRKLWWTITYVHQVSGFDSHADFQIRSIFALVF